MIVYASIIGKDKTGAKNAILQAHGNRTGKSVTIDRLSGGKPVVLYNGKREGGVSVSHTDGLLVIAFSESEVGIDIERTDRQVSDKICKDIREWTRYEAYGKYLGTGISKKLLQSELPEGLIDSYTFGEYVISLASEDKKVDIINLTSQVAFDIII